MGILSPAKPHDTNPLAVYSKFLLDAFQVELNSGRTSAADAASCDWWLRRGIGGPYLFVMLRHKEARGTWVAGYTVSFNVRVSWASTFASVQYMSGRCDLLPP